MSGAHACESYDKHTLNQSVQTDRRHSSSAYREYYQRAIKKKEYYLPVVRVRIRGTVGDIDPLSFLRRGLPHTT